MMSRKPKAPEFPAAPPPLPPLNAFRVVQSFNREGLHFEKGDVVTADNPIVMEVYRTYLGYLEIARRD